MKDEYEIVYGEEAEILSAKVMRRLEDGWVLHGYPYVKDDEHCQAMIKKNKETKEKLND
jgi:hypothetical protein